MENDNDPVSSEDDNDVDEEPTDDDGDFSASSEDWVPDGEENVESDSSSGHFQEQEIPSKRNINVKNKVSRWKAAPKVLTRRLICRKVVEPKTKPYECVEIIEPSTVTQKRSYESDSDSSSGDEHLTKPTDLNLNSTFFQIETNKNVPDFNEIEKSIMNGVDRLTDDSSEEDFDEVADNNEENSNEPEEDDKIDAEQIDDFQKKRINFQQLHDHAKKLADAKIAMENYKPTSKPKKEKLDIHQLLALGECKPDEKTVEIESGSEDDEFEEVKAEAKKQKSKIPKEGIEITVALSNPQTAKHKKQQDVMDMIKRRMNNVKKQYQVYMHKVHVLCWIAHGNYVNSIINSDILMSVCLSLIPSKDCYPPKQADIKYLEMILKWFVTKMQYDDRKTPKEISSIKELEKNNVSLLESLTRQITNKKAETRRDLILIFVCILRTLGLQCRLVLSFQPLPLKPPASELCSLSKKPTEKPKEEKTKRRESSKHKVSVSRSEKNGKDKEKKKVNFYKIINLSEVEKGKTDLKVDTTEIDSKLFKNDTNLPKKAVPKKADIAKKIVDDKPPERKLAPAKKPNLKKLRKTDSDLDEDWDKSMEAPKARPKRILKKKNLNSEIVEKPNLPRKKPVKKKIVETVNTEEMLQMENYKNMDIAEKVKMGRRTAVMRNILLSEKSTDYDSAFDEMDKVEIKAPWKVKIAKTNTVTKKTISDPKANIGSKEKIINSKKTISKLNTDASSSKVLVNKSEDHKEVNKNAIKSSTVSEVTPTTTTTKPNSTAGSIKNSVSTKSKNPKEVQENITVAEVKSKAALKINPQFSAKKTRSKTRLLNDPNNLKISQLDGADDEKKTRSKKPDLSKLSKLNKVQKNSESPTQNRSPFTKKNMNNHIVNLDIPGSSKESDAELLARAKSTTENVSTSRSDNKKSSKSSEKRKLITKSDTESEYKSPLKKLATSEVNIKTVNKGKNKTTPKRKSKSDSEDEFRPSPKKKHVDNNKTVVEKSKKKDSKSSKVEQVNSKTKGCDIWVEVFLESEEKWISVDVPKMHVHCINLIYARATHPVMYAVAWNNDKTIKDITRKYVPHWNTVTRKLRVDPIWWEQSIKPWVSKYKSIRDKMEDEDLNRMLYDQPLPASIVEYKNHPLYVLERHLLKFEAIYPPDAPTLGFCKKEPVYARECVYLLHSREIWVKQAKVVRPGEKPYKIVKARPKYDRLNNKMITDIPLEIFGPWQTQDYEPPVAENGIVPRNAYGNVELFKACMLPINTVHLDLPGLNKVARKLRIDCAPAVTGFDFHGGFSHPTFEGFVVCKEFKDTLVDAWEQEQVEAEQKAAEKIEKRVYDNWRKLIKGLFIRERIKKRYQIDPTIRPKEPEPPKKKVKPATFCTKRRR